MYYNAKILCEHLPSVIPIVEGMTLSLRQLGDVSFDWSSWHKTSQLDFHKGILCESNRHKSLPWVTQRRVWHINERRKSVQLSYKFYANVTLVHVHKGNILSQSSNTHYNAPRNMMGIKHHLWLSHILFFSHLDITLRLVLRRARVKCERDCHETKLSAASSWMICSIQIALYDTLSDPV